MFSDSIDIDIEKWVKEDPSHMPLVMRQAVHTVLHAISNSRLLKSMMILKGGILMAICYQSSRYTHDIDFSTTMTRGEFDEEQFKKEFEQSLARSIHELPYGLDCKIQSARFNPPGEDKTMPTLVCSIGYAYFSDRKLHSHLARGQSIKTIQIDLSVNEQIINTEAIQIGEKSIKVYDHTDLIAEKIRAILQQPVRNRDRWQDIYDIYYLINHFTINGADRYAILQSLLAKAAAREINPSMDSILDPSIRERSKKSYENLDVMIGDKPDFDLAFQCVVDFYQSLPWAE